MPGLKSFLFENKSMRQTVLKNTFWLTFGNISSRLIRAALIIYAARVLGVAGYGVFSYALSLAGFFAIFADIGLTPLLTRESARNPAKRQEYLGTALAIKFLFIAVSALIILFVAPFFAKLEGAKTLFPIIVFLFAFDTLRAFFFGYTRSVEKMEIEAGTNILTNLAILVLGGGALLIFPSIKMLTVGYTAGSAVGLIAVLVILRKNLRNIFSSFRKELVKPILTEAWPFALAGLLGTIMLNTDTLMLGWLRGASDVGLYSAAQKIIMLVYLLPGYLIVSLFPALSRLAKVDDERFRAIFEKGIKAMFLLAFPFASGGILLAPQIINLVYGASYLGAAEAFSILLITFFLVFPGTLVSNAVFAYNRQKLFMGFIALGAVANVIFNFLLIPPYGIFGSAIATIISQLLANGFNWFMMKRINDFKTLHHLPRILAGTFAMSIVILALEKFGANTILTIISGGAAYLAALKIIKEPLIEDLNPLAIIRGFRKAKLKSVELGS